MKWLRDCCSLFGGSAPATPGFNAVAPEWLAGCGAAAAAPAFPAAESTLGSHPCVALSSAQVLPEWTTTTPPCNHFAANGVSPLNFVSHPRGSLQSWQNRPLDALYPIVYLDALYVKIRDNGQVQNRAIYLAIGIKLDGNKEVLGMWTSANEGAKFWLQVLTELRNRGVEDVFIVCVDGLKGFPEAIETVYPQAQVQLCIVHLVRASLNYVSWKQRKAVAADLRLIYRAPTAEAAEQQLEAFASKWDATHPTISQIWRRNWARVIPFFGFSPEIRKVIYTTNAVESLNMTLRKVIKTRAAFPTEEAALKLLYMALQNVAKKWSQVQGWR